MQKNILTPSKLLLYVTVFFLSLALDYVGDFYEPFSLALLFACFECDLAFLPFSLIFLISQAFSFSPVHILISFAQAVFLCVFFAIRNQSEKRHEYLPYIGLTLGLFLFVFFEFFDGYALPAPFDSIPVLGQKCTIASVVFISSAVFTVALKAVLKKLLRCRLRTDEIAFLLLSLVLAGVGCIRAGSLPVYTGVALFFLLSYAFVTKDSSTVLCAFILSVPAFFFGVSPERFFVYGVVVTVLIKSGRLFAVFGVTAVFFLYAYFDGLFLLDADGLISGVLSVVLPDVFFLIVPPPAFRRLQNKLIFYKEKQLTRIAINRNRASVGEQLYEMSGVFREIQSTFNDLGSSQAEEKAKEFIRSQILENVCKRCQNYDFCQRKNLTVSLENLIGIGCAKGKVSLIDVPLSLAEICADQSSVLYAVNAQLCEYKKYMLEAENASSGRQLLANQAYGVSEILRNLALEQSAPLVPYTEKERKLTVALLKAGIVCSEVLLSGEEDNLSLSLVTFGKADVKKISCAVSAFFGVKMTISERLTLSQDKFCCILKKQPAFDAAFGVATTKKSGETDCGDTYSVIKIDERRFMVALSDGMGSGEYARKISEATISLLESFYRAKMSPKLILSTVNKLLSFSPEETFACVDIAVVDLDSGRADIVKIGSPVGFILSGNSLKVLEGGSLPLGILESLHPDTSSYLMQQDDVLLFLSDGITSAFGSSTDLYEVLKKIPAENPQTLADELLKKVLADSNGVAKDDMTVVAVRLFRSVA